MNYRFLLMAIIFIIILGFQYTLNLILKELRDIKRYLERLLLIKKNNEEEK